MPYLTVSLRQWSRNTWLAVDPAPAIGTYVDSSARAAGAATRPTPSATSAVARPALAANRLRPDMHSPDVDRAPLTAAIDHASRTGVVEALPHGPHQTFIHRSSNGHRRRTTTPGSPEEPAARALRAVPTQAPRVPWAPSRA